MAASRAGDEPWEQHLLPGGAQLILAPMAGRDSVAAAVLVRVGSRWEPLRLAGISHFLEHMVFKGTRSFPTSRDVSQAIEGLGGVLNASTDKELTTFWAKVPGRHLGLAVQVLTELVFAPRIEVDEAERERNVVLEELRMYLDQPGDRVQMLFDDLLFGRHPLARDPAGTKASVGRIAAAELKEHCARYYVPERMVVVIAGGFDPAAARALVEGAMASTRADLAPGEDGGVPRLPSPAPEVRVRRQRGEQAHLLLGVRCGSYLDPSRWTMDVLNTVLGEGMSSRLFLELREKQALAYDVHSFAARHHDSGAFGIYLATQPDRVQTSIRAALDELAKLAQTGLSEAELERAKAQIEGRLRLQLEGTSSMSEFLGHQAALMGTVLSADEVITAVRRVSADEVQQLARQLLAGGGWRLAAVGPRLDSELAAAAVAEGVAA